MLRDAVRGVVVVAAEVAEEAGKRVLGAAEELLERSGVDVAAVERRFGGQFPPSAEALRTLAGEAVTAGRAGIDLVTGVARSEVERVFEKVGDQVVKVGVVLSFLESKLREVEEEQPPADGPAAKSGKAGRSEKAAWAESRADGLFGAGWDGEEWGAGEPESAPAEQLVRKAPAGRPEAAEAAEQKATEKKTAARKPAVKKPAAKDTAAKKTAAKKAAAKKSVAKKTVTKQAAAGAATRKAAAKKTVVRKSAAKKAAPGAGTGSDA